MKCGTLESKIQEGSKEVGATQLIMAKAVSAYKDNVSSVGLSSIDIDMKNINGYDTKQVEAIQSKISTLEGTEVNIMTNGKAGGKSTVKALKMSPNMSIELTTKDGSKHVLNLEGTNEQGSIKVPAITKLLKPFKEARDKAWEDSIKNIGSYASDIDTELGDASSEEIVDTLMNDPASVKKMMKDLREADENTISDFHYKVLEKVVDMYIGTVGKAIPGMLNVYMLDKAEKNGGEFVLNKGIKLQMGKKNKLAKSMVEIYVHELIHASTVYARHSTDAKVRRAVQELEKLRLKILPRLKPGDLIPNRIGEPTELELNYGEAAINYMSSKDTGLEEFITYSLTNEPMINAINNISKDIIKEEELEDKTLWDKIVEYALTMFEGVKRIAGQQVLSHKEETAIQQLVLTMVANNNKAVVRRKEGLSGKMEDFFVNTNDKWSQIINKWDAKAVEKMRKKHPTFNPTGSTYSKVKSLASNAARLALDPETRVGFETTLSAIGLKEEGVVQTVIHQMREKDSLTRTIENMLLRAGNIDRKKENMRHMYHSLVLEGFTEKPAVQHQEAMTTIGLDLDLSSIYSKLGSSKIAKLLTNTTELSKEIEDTKNDIKELDSSNYNYYTAQAKGLGNFMVTHVPKAVYLYNAKSIASKLNMDQIFDPDEELITAIDKLATLEALQVAEQGDKDALADLIAKDSKGVDNFMAFHSMYKDVALREAFEGKQEKIVKGQIKEIYDGDISTKIIRVEDLKEFEAKGYEKVEDVKVHKKDKSLSKLVLVINRDNITKTYDKALIRLKDEHVLGTSLVETKKIQDNEYGSSELLARARNDMVQITNSMYRQLKMMEKGTYDPSKDEYDLLAVHNEKGEVESYSYIMPKAQKKTLMDQEVKAPVVLAGMFTDVYDLKNSKEFNREVFNLAKKDAIENGVNPEARVIKSDAGKNYIMLEENSNNKIIRDIWNILPKDFAKLIKEEGYNGKLPLRRDALLNYTGSRKLSVADVLPKSTSTYTKHLVRHIGSLWQEFVSIAAGNIIIKTPAVFKENVKSNFNLSVKFGISPMEVFRLQMDGVKYLKEYLDTSKKLEKLKARKAAKVLDNLPTTNTDIQIKVLESILTNSPVANMMDRGMYSGIIEDSAFSEARSQGKISKTADKFLNYLHPYVRTGVEYTFLSSKTKLYKLMSTMIQFSDFVARYALIQALLRQGPPPSLKDYTAKQWEEYVINLANDAMIVYPSQLSPLHQYAEDMGFIKFSKYFIRIQNVIRQGARKHPVNFLAAILGQELLGDVSDVTDQNLLTKDYGNLFYSPYTIAKEASAMKGLELVT